MGPNIFGKHPTSKEESSGDHYHMHGWRVNSVYTSVDIYIYVDYMHIYIYLFGGWPTPLKNMKVSQDYSSQYMETWNSCFKPPTRYSVCLRTYIFWGNHPFHSMWNDGNIAPWVDPASSQKKLGKSWQCSQKWLGAM